MPVALMDEPPTPLIVRGEIGFRSKKSDVSGEMLIVAPESRMNGPNHVERLVQVLVFMEATKASFVDTDLLLSCQFTDAE